MLVNGAGGVLGQVGRPVEAVALDDWRGIVDVNMTGAFLAARAAAPGIKAAPTRPVKAGQIGLTRQLARELGPFGITVNAVAPGFVRSNPATERQWEALGSEGQRRLVEAITLKRLGTPEDVAAVVLFFTSDAARWVTGQVLSVDGGK